jgi:alpha-mannosidase
MVYVDAEQLYAEVAKDGKELLDEALQVILGMAPSNVNVESRLVGYNTTPFSRRDVVAVPLTKKSPASLKSQMAQISKDGDTGYALMSCKEGSTLATPDGLWADCKPVSGQSHHPEQSWLLNKASVFTNGADHFVLRNAALQLTISGGRITSLYDVELG